MKTKQLRVVLVHKYHSVAI